VFDGIIHNDGGTMKVTSAATFKTYFQAGISSAADDITAGDAAVNITTSSGNITIDAAANDSDIIFKGTDATADITMLTLDGSDAGTAIFNHDIKIADDGQIGSASAADAMIISSAGIVTFKDDILIKDGGTIGSASDADAITIAANGQLTLTQTLIGTALDISGDIDVDGTTNLDVVDIDGAVDMASTLQVDGAITSSAAMTITVADNSETLTLVSTDADASLGPMLSLYRNSSSPADNDTIGRIKFIGRNDNSQDFQSSAFTIAVTDVSDGAEDAKMDWYIMSNGAETLRLSYQATETVFNDASIDMDFRVESNGQTHMLFVDGARDAVGIGSDTPDSGRLLHIEEGGTAVGITLKDTAGTQFGITSDDNSLTVKNDSDSKTLVTIEESGVTNINDHTASANNQALNVTSRCTARAGLFVSQQNASFGNASYGALRVDTLRANSNAFNHAVFRANDGADIGFKFRGDGNAYADNNWNSGGADYAEYFEWKDGNSSSEDRRGYTVVLDGNQIRKSTSDDAQSSILGVVSATPAMVGDTGQMNWQGKYEKDEWGSYIFEEYTQTEWTVEDDDKFPKEFHSYQTDKIPSDVTVPSDAVVTSTETDGSTKLMRRKESSSYDASKTYVTREDRKEWDTIGLVGKLRVKVGQRLGDRWIKMREISDTVHEYLVR
jgi:hypothetical protein